MSPGDASAAAFARFHPSYHWKDDGFFILAQGLSSLHSGSAAPFPTDTAPGSHSSRIAVAALAGTPLPHRRAAV